MTRLFVSFLLLLSVTAASVAYAQEKKIIVFAAASLKNALDDVDAAFTKLKVPLVLNGLAAAAIARTCYLMP